MRQKKRAFIMGKHIMESMEKEKEKEDKDIWVRH